MNPSPQAPDGRVRAVLAAMSATLETAGFLARALGLICAVVLAFLAVTLIGELVRALF